jgi:hypothetical protein
MALERNRTEDTRQTERVVFNSTIYRILTRNHLIMKTAIQVGHTVPSWIFEIHKPFSITYVFVGELLSGIIGVIFFNRFDYYFGHRRFNNWNKVYLYASKTAMVKKIPNVCV